MWSSDASGSLPTTSTPSRPRMRSGNASPVMTEEKKRQWILFGVFLFAVVFIYKLSGVGGGSSTSQSSVGPAMRVRRYGVWDEGSQTKLVFGVVADLDRQSKMEGKKKPTFRSIFQRGSLTRRKDGTYALKWGSAVDVVTQLAEAGRGGELSELVEWKGDLLTFDDRTGVVFKIAKNYELIPLHILMEGNGETSKGEKIEWATVKDGSLYVGSFGKEYTNNDGSSRTRNNLWISVIDAKGNVKHIDWTETYNKIRKKLHAAFPGYIITEAIHWEPIERRWWVLPRRVSSDPYDEKKDERMGSNIVLSASEDFSSFREMRVGPQIPLRGWSSVKFLPGTKNRVLVALKTEEEEDKITGSGAQDTYITVFDVNGKVLLPQTQIPGNVKFEGIEFL